MKGAGDCREAAVSRPSHLFDLGETPRMIIGLRPDRATGCDLVYPDVSVRIGGKHLFAIRRERDRAHGSGMSSDRLNDLASQRVENPEHPVLASRGSKLSVRRQ